MRSPTEAWKQTGASTETFNLDDLELCFEKSRITLVVHDKLGPGEYANYVIPVEAFPIDLELENEALPENAQSPNIQVILN